MLNEFNFAGMLSPEENEKGLSFERPINVLANSIKKYDKKDKLWNEFFE